ncbi:MAG: hypothetical protein IJJ01_04655 [Firmicutes bacterium]|nr:hypothetical protein [Bacillota bacterium]
MNSEQVKSEYELFFRNGGYRLMKLLVLKAEAQPDGDRDSFDVVSLMRLQRCCDDSDWYSRARTQRNAGAIWDIYELDLALTQLLDCLPWGWGEVIDLYFGRGIKTKTNGVKIRKKGAENALMGACRAIENNGLNFRYGNLYSFTGDGIHVIRKIMSYLEQASAVGTDASESWLMRAVTSMKLFRDSRQGIIYIDALEEFCERVGVGDRRNTSIDGREMYWEDTIGTEELADEILIRGESWDGQQMTRLESKVYGGRSSELIDRMYDVYAIMYAISQYLPDKYEQMMSFHWTRKNEKLISLFLEMAAMLVASDQCVHNGTTED